MTAVVDAVEVGRAARTVVPRRAQADLPLPERRDPVGILLAQNTRRLPELVGLRLERTLAEPFAFYRATAALQAADLAVAPTSGARTVVSGDAHLLNFGVFASPQRALVFDLNDFDEVAYGAWEWDLKRLAASVAVAARARGADDAAVHDAARRVAKEYRIALRELVRMPAQQRYFLHANVDAALGRVRKEGRREIRRVIRAADKRTADHVVRKVTEPGADGFPRFVHRPPVLSPVTDGERSLVDEFLARYLGAVAPDIAVLLAHFRVRDVARRVVGVGSVGTRCYLALLTSDAGEPLLLQVKEATRSVLDEFAGAAPVAPPLAGRVDASEHGYRVIAGQRVLQAVSDPFLGHVTINDRGYYVRQFRDRNASALVTDLAWPQFLEYGAMCARMLARAHSQGDEAGAIAAYAGASEVLDEAIARWSERYADRSLADFRIVAEAHRDGVFD